MNKQFKSIFHPFMFGRGLGVHLLLYGSLLLFVTSCTEADRLMERSRETVVFSLPTGGVASDPAVTRADGDGVNIVAGTTVRVLAYRRPAGAADAELSSANYAGEATYKVVLGSVLELCAVSLDANGTPSIDASGMLVPLELIAGNYDFYAVTPALEVNHSGNEPTLQVRHHTDYAVSVTSKPISPGNGNVGLTTLQRHCSLLTFNTDRAADVTAVTSVEVGEVSLSNMTVEPITATSTQALSIASAARTFTLTLPDNTFITPDPSTPYKTYGEVVCLPKSSAEFILKMNVGINGVASVLLEAPGITMSFDPCNHYAFTVRFKGEKGIELLVGVEPWTDFDRTTQIGGSNIPVQVVVGEWTDVDFGTNVGGNHIPPFTPNVAAWGDLDSAIQVGGKQN